MGTCPQCPPLQVDVNIGVDTSKQFIFQEWKKGGANKPGRDGEERIVFSLLNTELPIGEGITLLQERTLSLKRHIYVAYHMWEMKRVTEQNLGPDTLMMLSDYQQNLQIELGRLQNIFHF